jgi:hypothetical protein
MNPNNGDRTCCIAASEWSRFWCNWLSISCTSHACGSETSRGSSKRQGLDCPIIRRSDLVGHFMNFDLMSELNWSEESWRHWDLFVDLFPRIFQWREYAIGCTRIWTKWQEILTSSSDEWSQIWGNNVREKRDGEREFHAIRDSPIFIQFVIRRLWCQFHVSDRHFKFSFPRTRILRNAASRLLRPDLLHAYTFCHIWTSLYFQNAVLIQIDDNVGFSEGGKWIRWQQSVYERQYFDYKTGPYVYIMTTVYDLIERIVHCTEGLTSSKL